MKKGDSIEETIAISLYRSIINSAKNERVLFEKRNTFETFLYIIIKVRHEFLLFVIIYLSFC